MTDEWGPWIEHDGKSAPSGRMFAQWEYEIPPRREHNPEANLIERISTGWTNFSGRSWRWDPNFICIIRYRIRKPRALTMLQEIARDVTLPVRTDA